MRVLRIFFCAVFFVGVILIAGSVGTYLLVDDDRLIGFVIQKIESSTTMTISCGKKSSMTRTLFPTFVFNDLSIEDSDTQVKIHSSKVQVQFGLSGLLRGKLDILKLVLGDTRIEIKDGEGGQTFKSQGSFPLLPVFHDVQISRITILRANEEFTIPDIGIQHLTIKAQPDNDTLVCSLKAGIGSDIWEISVMLPSQKKILSQQQLLFSMEAVSPQVDLAADGRINFDSSHPSIAAELRAETTGDGPVKSAGWLVSVLPESLGILKQLTVSTKISGAYPVLKLSECKLNLKTMAELDMTLTGELDLVHDDTGAGTANMDMALSFSAPTTRAARALIFETVPEFGVIQGRANIRSEKGPPSLDQIVIKTKDTEGIQVNLTGGIASFPLNPDISNTGYDLDVTMASTRASVMGKRVDIDLPLKGPLDIKFKIKGDTQALLLKQIKFFAGKKDDVLVTAEGQLGFGNWDLDDPLEHVDLKLNLETPDSKILETIVGKEVPNLGRISARAHLNTVSKIHGLHDIKIHIGKPGPLKIDAAGSIRQVIFFPRFAARGLNLAASSTGDDLASLSDVFSLPFPVPANNGFKAQGVITGNQQGVSLTDLSFKTQIKDKDKQTVTLDVTGRMTDVENIETLVLNARMDTRDLRQIGSIFGQPWEGSGYQRGPVSLKSQILNKDKTLNIDTNILLGDIRIEATNNISFRAGKLFVSGKIKAENMFFPQLMQKQQKKMSENKSESTVFFSRDPFDFTWLSRVDTDLLIDIPSFEKENTPIESACLELLLETGRLSIAPATLIYPKGEVQLDVHLDAQHVPVFSIKVSGRDIDPWQTLSHRTSGYKDSFDAQLDVDIDVTTTGGSKHEMAANLDGEIYMLIKNGKIRKEPIDMLFTDLIGWTYSKATGEKYVDIDCGVADYSIANGVIKTNAFIIDGQTVAVTGEGTVDLGNEWVDYVFLPKKKSKFIGKADPVKVKGPLANPSIKLIPWKSAVSTYGTLIFGPYIFAGWTAVDFLMGRLGSKPQLSPCQEYESKYKKDKSKK